MLDINWVYIFDLPSGPDVTEIADRDTTDPRASLTPGEFDGRYIDDAVT